MQSVSTDFINAALNSDTMQPAVAVQLVLFDNTNIGATATAAATDTQDTTMLPASQAINGQNFPTHNWGYADPYDETTGADIYPGVYPIDAGYQGGWWSQYLSDSTTGAIVPTQIDTLNANINNSQITFAVTSGAIYQPSQVLLMDNEQMLVLSIVGTTVKVTRGYNSTTPFAHNSGVAITQLNWVITVNYGAAVTINNLIAYGDAILGCPVNFSFLLTLVGGSTVTVNVTSNFNPQWVGNLLALTGTATYSVTAISLSITKINKFQACATILQFGGVYLVDLLNPSQLHGFNVMQERATSNATLQIGNVGAGSISLQLDNSSGNWGPFNASSPYYPFLKTNRKVYVQVGYVEPLATIATAGKAILSGDTTITPNTIAPFYALLNQSGPNPAVIQIGSEQIKVTGFTAGGNAITVQRGYNGTSPGTYSVGASILQLSPSKVELIPFGTYYSMRWNAPGGGPVATMEGQDRMKRLREKLFLNCAMQTSQTVDVSVANALTAFGMVTGDYIANPTSVSVPYAWATPSQTYFQYLQNLVAAVGGVLYMNALGQCVFQDVLYLHNNSITSVVTLTDANARISSVDNYDEGQIKNRVTVTNNALQVQSSSTIFTLLENLSVPANGTLTLQIVFNSPAISVAQGTFTAGAGVTVQSLNTYAQSAVVVFANSTGSPVNVTAYTLTGQVLQTSGTMPVISENTSLESSDGQRDLPFNNPFVQSRAAALTIGANMLTIYQNPQPALHIECIGLPHLEVGDRITVNSTEQGINGDYWLVRHRFTYDGGFHSSMDLVGVV